MEELLKYYMDETNRRLSEIEEKLEDLKSFKVSMLASAKVSAIWAGALVSGATGIVTMLVTLWASGKIG